MPNRPMAICSVPGCSELVPAGTGYCEKHAEKQKQKRKESFKEYDKQRGSASERGYDYRWQKYSRWFLKQPENVFCKLQLPGCTNLSECVDHIDPPDGPKDPRFWDKNNHQGACLHCNSVKGHKKIVGTAEPFEASMKG